MKTNKQLLFIVLFFSIINSILFADGYEIRKIATWNMKWLGTNSYNQLDAIENVSEYAKVIMKTEASLFALQEVGASHSSDGKARCFYLDLIINELYLKSGVEWKYILDEINKNQRLAFLFRTDKWHLSKTKSIKPGSSYNYIRKPFFTHVSTIDGNFSFNFINIHFKAFDDEKSIKKREKNILELSEWIEKSTYSNGNIIIAGDTNIYPSDKNPEEIFKKANIHSLIDDESSSIHEDKLSNRFDRFYISSNLFQNLEKTSMYIGEENVVDVIKNDSKEYIIWFDKNVSDHFPVIMNLITNNLN